VQELQYTFIKDWHFMTDEDPDGLLTESHFPHIDPEGEAMVRLVNSGPALGRDALIDTLFAMIGAAEEDLIIVTAYFVPTLDIIRAIRAAALRGVTVRVIVPRKSNHVYAGFAARARYGELLDAGVRIFEREPPFMHAKALLVDQSMALVGTANMDVRSFHLNYESNMVVLEEGFVDRMKQIVLDDLAQSREVNLHEWKRRPAHRRVRENLAYLMMPQL
jgi:cardiolipin synthase